MSTEPTSQPSAEQPAAPQAPPAIEPMTPALRAKLQRCYDHAKKLMMLDKFDFNYVSTLLTECVTRDPGNLVYIETYLASLHKKFGPPKKKNVGGALKGIIKKAQTKGDWREVARLAYETLNENPYDVPTLRVMAEFCGKHGLNEVELRWLKSALDVSPKDPEVSKHCAISLARMGQFDQAIACWHRVEELRPRDPEPTRMIAELTLEKNRPPEGVNPDAARSSAARPGMAGKPAAASPANTKPEKREIVLTPRQRLERAMAQNPGDVETALELAQLHLDEGRHADAAELLNRTQQAAGTNLKIQEMMEEVQIHKMRSQVAIAEKRAAFENTDQARELAQQLRQEAQRVELEVYGRRAEKFPTDLGIKFQLGMALKRAGNYAEAFKLLQEARTDLPRKAVCTLEMGECAQHLKRYRPAIDLYKRAAEVAAEQNQPEIRKSALYRAGVLAAGMKEVPLAMDFLAQVVEIDANYKDAQARLDKLRQIGDKV